MPDGHVFQTANPWNAERPRVLVVACSDGRLQEPLDEFLGGALGVHSYDRLYIPGGPGALSQAGYEYLRASGIVDELNFLIRAHLIERVLLIYHGPAEDGPDEAVCADYRRIYPARDADWIRAQQEADTAAIVSGPLRNFPRENLQAYRLEVTDVLGIDVRQLA